ncbi:FAA hydrolase family protein [Paenibacillus sambharensis]|uniref:FAA hydrolase family protein n=1 Tax=Paenibacillus sambharensis TaxID=1803190 RepID=A0A2W1L4X5_9BACL|nr:fumarylacetoacetate hydrolase family protein [Paenibacillus sambharensis]PZD94396.1 FAA hydrolase family protein [Paenibacillus sambharensis]
MGTLSTEDLQSIRNIYCVGRNYAQHAKELGNEVPAEPIVFLKPTHAAVPLDGGAVQVEGKRGAVHYEVELVLRIGRRYEPGVEPDAIIDGLGLGLDLTLRDEQSTAKSAGLPWLSAKGFPSSALLTGWQEYPGKQALYNREFSLKRNGQEVQRGSASEMLFHTSELIRYIGQRFGLDAGDIIFTGTPAGVGALEDGDLLECFLAEKLLGSCRIALQK